MKSEVLFIPVIFMCGNNEGYKKVQLPITVLNEHIKLVDKIKDSFGFSKIDKETIIYPVMQLYNPVDFIKRDIGLFLRCLCDELCKHIKKQASLLPLERPLVSHIYTSTGVHRYKEMQPVFKPLNEIPNVKEILINGDIPVSKSAMLFFLLPIILCHYNLKKLHNSVEIILTNEINDDKMKKLSEQINEYYNLKQGNLLCVLPISHSEFIEDDFTSFIKSMNEEINKEKILSN